MSAPKPHESTDPPLLDVRAVSVYFPGRRGGSVIRAVEQVSLQVMPGRTLALVGESGSGKTTLARAVAGLAPMTSGDMQFDGSPLPGSARQRSRELRQAIQIVFQDPGGSLNPRMRIGAIVAEPLIVHRLARGRTLKERVGRLLECCGLPTDAAGRYPHEFSGGQRQRIAIARAIALEPRLVICDEPTSALDVSVQAQILNLLADLQTERGMAYLFISHDMAVVDHVADDVAVMRHGRIVESGPAGRVLGEPAHDYTRALISAAPTLVRSS